MLGDKRGVDLIRLEKRRRTSVEEKEASWRLKSRAIWLKCGDENTFFSSSEGKCPIRFGNLIERMGT
jgi:hypothetical protein